jgi:hypothetical protein
MISKFELFQIGLETPLFGSCKLVLQCMEVGCPDGVFHKNVESLLKYMMVYLLLDYYESGETPDYIHCGFPYAEYEGGWAGFDRESGDQVT